MPTPNERLRRERQLRGWSQGYLAEQIGVPDYYISRWERGEVLPSPYYQQKLCGVFGKTAEELGMLPPKAEGVLSNEQKMNENDHLAAELPEDTPLVEQMSPPQEPLPSQPTSASSTLGSFTSVPISPPSPLPLAKPRRLRRKGKILALLTLFLLVGTGLGMTLLLVSRANSFSATVVVGNLYYLSSGQISETSNQGIADEVRLDLSSVHTPAPGKSLYAWLLPDENLTENPVIPLGKIVISGGMGRWSYSDLQHRNLLAISSGLLVTEQDDAAITPLNPSTDRSTWRYLGRFAQTRASGQPYSLLDHLRHLLAADPKLGALHLPGGVNTWLYRNMLAVFNWSTSAREASQAGVASNTSYIRQQAIRILDYLDGIIYVRRDLPATITSPVLVDSQKGRIGLLEFEAGQEPPGYLDHLDSHLNGLVSSPGASDQLRKQVAQIMKAVDDVHGWLLRVHQDAEQLVTMTDEQLREQQATTFLNDMATNTNFAYVGSNDPTTGQVQRGIEWIHQSVQNLAMMDIMPYTGK